jgi:histidinol-phosphatase (PHP family)
MHEAFVVEAVRLREKYASEIKLLIGFEGEWIRPSYGSLIKELASNPVIDYFIGSVHHVHEIPIDYDAAMYGRARDVAGGTDERLFEDYFDLQFEMLNALKPRVIGHLDLIRLLSEDPNRDLKNMNGVWEKVIRNLKVIVEQGGLMEINSSALRKGLNEPYPTRSVCEAYLGMGGKLTLSDDSHGIAHVGTNYGRAIEYLESLGVQEVYTLNSKVGAEIASVKAVSLASVKESFRA